MRNSLVAALVACADRPLKSEARRFLAGLSSDELQFVAEFLGSCVLESQVRGERTRAELTERIAKFQQSHHTRRRSSDQELKMLNDRWNAVIHSMTASSAFRITTILATIIGESMVGDLEERYCLVLKSQGRRAATRWFWREVIHSCFSLALDALKRLSALEKLIERYRRIGS